MPFIAGLALAVVLTPGCARIAHRLGLLDRPDGAGLKIHREAVPLLGGAAVTAATLTGVWVAGGWLPGVIVAAILVALLAGLADDLRPLPISIRLTAQALAGVVVIVEALPWEYGAAGAAATILLVLACTNAVNVLDGQDGLAAGTAAVASLGLALFLTWNEGTHAAALGFAAAGALGGFLVWNRPPARIYLGNGGAYAVGAIIAVLVKQTVVFAGWKGVLAAGLCLLVFASELLFTVARRTFGRKPLVGGDRFHSYDLLSAEIGRTNATVAFWSVGSLGTGLALATSSAGVAITAPLAVAAYGASGLAAYALWRRRAGGGS